jgi:DNA-3-methyladenine glycosylase II
MTHQKNPAHFTPHGGLNQRGLDHARRHLMRRDPRLADLMKRAGRWTLSPTGAPDPFLSLVRVIASQQLSTKAADTIFGRVVALVGGREHVTPEAILALDPLAVRGAGLSRPKVSYLRDLAERVADGRLDLHSFSAHTDEEIITAITVVKGLGRWSAEMFLMFRLNRPDIFPTGDLGIVKGMQKLHGMKRRPAERTMIRLAEPWRPYRTVAAWYLWRLLE